MVEKIKEFLESLGYTLFDTWQENGDGWQFRKEEPNGQKLEISVFVGKKAKQGRQTISKRDVNSYAYNNYEEFTPTELKFFDILDFEISYWHHYHTEQNAQDWASAGKIELEY